MLPENEFKLFGKFVRNPINNKKDTVIRLYQFVAKNYSNYDSRKFSKTQCFLYVFPELKPQMERLNGKADALISKKLKNPLYDLKNLIEAFIIEQEMAAQSHEKTILLIKGLFKRQMHDKAFQLIDKELKRLEGMIGDDFYHHFYQFQLTTIKLKNTTNKVKDASNLTQDSLKYLDIFFTHSKLKLGYESITRQRLLGDKVSLFLYDELLEYLNDKNIFESIPSILMFQKLAQLKANASFEEYERVKNYFFEKFDKILNADKKDLIIYFINFCLTKTKRGLNIFLEEIFEFYQFGLEHELLLENGKMYPDDFRNIVTIGTVLKKYDLVESFINEKSAFLPFELRNSIVLISRAQLEKSKGNLSKVIDLLKEVEFTSVHDNLVARSLLMRCYYELGEFHTLSYFLEAFVKFVKRNTSLSEEVKLAVLNMIKFTKILSNAAYKKPTKEKLKEKLGDLNHINSKNWLLKQIEKL